jgi:hypothetical protein
MLYRNRIRTIKNSTESTLETTTVSASTLAFALTTSDYFYVGFHEPFTTRYFSLGTVNSNAATITVSYWSGTSWTAVEDKIDQTLGFTQSGFIGWQNNSDWAKYALTPITDVELYWVRLSVSANLSAGTTLQSVLNIFCDDALLRSYYPELLSDSRYLPPSRSNFLEQYQAAKNLVVLRLQQKHAILDESEIIDINDVAIAAVHATAHIILNPIANNEETRARAEEAYKAFDNELNLSITSFDKDNSGIISTVEQKTETVFHPRW